MQYRKLGQSNLEVSVVALGCWALVGGDTWGTQDEQASLETINAALDAGINFFDTAEGYGDGRSEQLLAQALGNRRKDVIIASKVSPQNLTPGKIREACERSLRNLRTDTIDLYQIHWPNHNVPFEDSMRALQDLQDAGKIRYLGVSNFGPQDMQELLGYGRYESNQLPYNLLWRAIEYDIQDLCVENRISILPYSPLMQGLLTGKFHTAQDVPDGRRRSRHFDGSQPNARHGGPGYEAETFDAIDAIRAIADEAEVSMANVALAWLLAQPAVPSVLGGARNVQQLRDNVEAAEVALTDEIIEQLSSVTQKVKALLGPNPDMWAPPEESRYR